MLRLALLGMSNAEIGRELGCTAVTVSNCLNSSLGKQRLSEMRAAVDKKSCDTAVRLRELNEKALEVLEEILENEDAPMGLRAKVAMDNLSRTGFAPQINVKGTFDHRHFGPDEIERIKLFAIEAAKRQGCLILAEQATDVRLIAGQGSSNSQGSSDHGAGEQVDNQDTDVTIDIG
jgi:predicted transcriptional regulator